VTAGPTEQEPRRRPWHLLPPGALSIGAGLVVLGIGTYAFLVISARALGPERYGALSALWAMVLMLAGFFLPWEQEVSRDLSQRRVAGLGGRPVIVRATILGAGVCGLLMVAGVVLAPWLSSTFFDHDGVLVACLVLAVPGSFAANFVEGVLSGHQRFGRYGLYLGSEATVRAGTCLVLAVVGVTTVGPYGLLIGLSPLVALVPALWRAHGIMEPGPVTPWRPMVTALLGLMAGSLMALFLANLAPLLVAALASDVDRDAVGRFTAALVLARIPLFLFQAIQAAMLPQLTTMATQRRFDEFARLITRLAGGLALLAGVAAVLGWLVGPSVIALVFGESYRVSGSTIAALAAGSGAYMAAAALGQSVIALGGARLVAIAWTAGVVVMLAVSAVGGDVITRVQSGYLAGTVAAAIVMAGLTRWRWRRSRGQVTGDDMLDAVHDLPFEI